MLGGLAAAGGFSLFARDTAAEADLIESTWIAQSAKCAIREIKFYDFNHALVKADGIGSDEANWKQDSAMVHVYFQHWNGNLDGPIDDSGVFKATYTWRSDETLAITTMDCPFRRR